MKTQHRFLQELKGGISIKIDIKTSKKIGLNPNTYFDKIFIINLKTSPERWQKIKTNLIENGIYNFERQEGIYLPRVNPYKQLKPHLYRNLEAYGGVLKNDHQYILNAVGTNLAHYHIIKKSIQRNYKRILILEDDSYLTRDFTHRFSQGMSYLEKNPWDLIYFGFKKSSTNFGAKRISPQLIIPFNRIRGAYGYALNSSSFQHLIRNYLYRGMEIDVFFEYIMMRHHRVYAFYPQIIGHRDRLQSTITNKNWKGR